ncbi:NAD(P)-dependent oxidoreductase [Actinoplanes sp. NBRC 103695]|uniref:NAD(P)-dependent oxidoreductase n=1 Tax=Actinoplanes sp. NBRC 103695 TaxID=3032202 RepID=UPI0024A5A6BA|nr:NAD(P)-dependent oxidoreductase [Actinoplanes sp. NBRC 103695]GLY98601.1 2-hydroxy-3-oxopropionate reductase [Actinoplanes sp. NBRC 103695]
MPEPVRSSEPITSVGFIGLGNMGLPMATRLVKAGYQVDGYDVSPAAGKALTDAGGIYGDDLRGVLMGNTVVILMLPDSDVVDSVVRDEGFDTHSWTTVIDMSSSEPLRTRALAEELAQRKVTLLDAPVSGGVKGAINGKLTIMAGGDPEDIAEVAPILAHLGKVTRAGDVGSGHAVKALNNLLSATHLLVTSEAMLAGERFGLDPRVMLEIFNGSSGRSGSTDNKWPNFVLPGTFDSGFGLRLMLKDMRIAAHLADQVGVPDPLGHAAVELWAEAAEALDAGADHTEIVNWLRKDESR